MTRTADPATTAAAHRDRRRGLLLIGTAIVLTGVNLRTAVNSIGPVLEETFAVPETGPIGLEGDRGQMEYRRIQIQTK